jgi:hypothetical protein
MLPEGSQLQTLRVFLNGKDASERFSAANCPTGVCASGVVSAVDGLHAGKNVLYAAAKSESGKMISSRMRFAGDESRIVGRAASARRQMSANDVILPTASAFLPPTILLKTLTPGGWDGADPWLQLGSQLKISGPASCSGIYSAIVLDRQTLEEKTDAPESSPYCAADAPHLATYLKALSSRDLVVVGTNWEHNADANLDTSAIGGTNYSSLSQSGSNYPRGYITIGAGGAAPGSAYENYWIDSAGQVNPFATGMVTEDANGNYNFQSTNAVEYIVSPSDPNHAGQSTVTVRNTPAYPGIAAVYTPPAATNGFWLLILNRTTLATDPGGCAQGSSPPSGEIDFVLCGTVYQTGNSDQATRTNAMRALTTALNGLTRQQLAVLTTVGTAAYSTSPWNVAGNNVSDIDTQWNDNGYLGFSGALWHLGAPDKPTLYLGQPGSAYTYITALGLGNAISGQSVFSTSVYSEQGQTGYVHGMLTRDLNGLYRPSRSSQSSPGSDYANFTVGLISSQAPVDWPELTAKLQYADSFEGQQAAYAYVSSTLLLEYYVRGLDPRSPYTYDIHYFFTGSLNTFLDYHAFSPSLLAWPGDLTNNRDSFQLPCRSIVPNPSNPADPTCEIELLNGSTYSFSYADFVAVRQQVSDEIVNLTNLMLFMVNGSTNMKDIVAAGNSNTALAMINAAATVEGSLHAPSIETAAVKVNSSSILSMIGGGLSTLTAIGTDDALNIEGLDKTITLLSDLFADASTASGGFTAGGGTAATGLPSPDYSLVTTIGELASSDLQGQMLAGFDTTLDSIAGDYGRLSTIGPLIVDTTNAGFYSPTQAMQNVAISLFNKASQRSLYLSLIPQIYQVHYWPSVYGVNNGTNYPDMGYGQGKPCNAFYKWPTSPSFTSSWYPTYVGQSFPFMYDWSTTPIDYYVLSAPLQNVGASDVSGAFPDETLLTTLFSNKPDALNFSFDEFVALGGPMMLPPVGPSAFIMANALLSNGGNFAGHTNNRICSYNEAQLGTNVASANATTTTLTVPDSVVLGQSLSMQAKVTTSSGLAAGSVQFRDGATVLNTATLDGNGTAIYTTSGLSLGTHLLAAYYLYNDETNGEASSSAVETLTVYASAPDALLNLSAGSLNVSYGTTSTPIAMQISSQYGFTGTLSFDCVGLPVNTFCTFKPVQATVPTGGSSSTSFTVSSSGAQTAGVASISGIALLSLPITLLSLYRIRKMKRELLPLLAKVLLGTLQLGSLSGCGRANADRAIPQGTRTILVSASDGSFTRTIPLTINFQ